jgi:hypothetical protein
MEKIWFKKKTREADNPPWLLMAGQLDRAMLAGSFFSPYLFYD